LPSCKGSGETARKLQAAPVSIEKAALRDIPVKLDAVGSVEAYSVVSVKSQIGGVLQKAHFKEGQDVRRGDILFTIDPRPQEAALKQAEAINARDKAQLENARGELKRYSELAKEGFVSAEKIAQLQTTADAMEAAEKASAAAYENARIQYGYSFITSPVNGVAGSYSINEGNLIKAGDDQAIAVIRQIQPIFVTFSLPERVLGSVKKFLAEGGLTAAAAIQGDGGAAQEGAVVFVDNAVDPATGTIKLKAKFSNKDKRLWPGQFVNISLKMGERRGVVTISSRAVQMGQHGPYVFVVKSDMTAETRQVEVSDETDGMAVVEKGIAAGETVVTDGHIKVLPGGPVTVKEGEGKKEAAK